MQCTGRLTQFTFPGSRPLLLLKGLIKIHIFPSDHVKDSRNRVHLWLLIVMGHIWLAAKRKNIRFHIMTPSEPGLF